MQAVAMLLVANTVVLVAGALGGEGSAGVKRPVWLPPLWIRAGIPLAVAAGLWFGQKWAWWLAVTMSAGMMAWIVVASFVLALGGYFTGDGAGIRVLHSGLLAATWLAALVLLLSG